MLHAILGCLSQILILAWPGVVVTFLMIGICGRYFFPYGWTWPQSLLFGAMLSATDPVAVVAVLHEVRVPKTGRGGGGNGICTRCGSRGMGEGVAIECCMR
jgi:NhaP-type Na+/H+ or K+/H+ antiporter